MDIGVFIPIGNNGWLISTTSPQYMPTFALNREIVQKAERYGLDFALSMIKLRGFGGKSGFWDHNLESFTLMAGLAAVTTEREPRQILDALKRAMGTYAFAGQYQQAPAPVGGGLVKTEWFKRYTPQDKPESFDRIVQSWDTANKVTELSDYSVCTTWGIKGKNLYLLHVLRKQLEYPDLKRAVRQQQQCHSASVVLIEDKASGTQLIQELIMEGFSAVTRYQPDGDKVMRMYAQTALIENGRVHLPTDAHWLDDYLRELAMFPNGRYDDQVDSTAQFLDWFKTPMPHCG